MRIGHGVGGPVMTLIAFVAVWATVHQVGFSFDALRTSSIGVRALVALGGLSGLLALTTWGPYPKSMVGTAGQEISNMGPPNITVVALALFQVGLVALFADHLSGLAERLRDRLADASRLAMPVFAWHLPAQAIWWGVAAGVGAGLGTSVASEVGSAWWWQRPLWLIGPTAVLVVLLRVGRLGRSGEVGVVQLDGVGQPAQLSLGEGGESAPYCEAVDAEALGESELAGAVDAALHG